MHLCQLQLHTKLKLMPKHRSGYMLQHNSLGFMCHKQVSFRLLLMLQVAYGATPSLYILSPTQKLMRTALHAVSFVPLLDQLGFIEHKGMQYICIAAEA